MILNTIINIHFQIARPMFPHTHTHLQTDIKLTCRVINVHSHETQIKTLHPDLGLWLLKCAAEKIKELKSNNLTHETETADSFFFSNLVTNPRSEEIFA